MIKQLFETHLDVADLERAMRFYENVLDLKLGHLDEGRRIAFYWMGTRMKTMLGLWEKKDIEIVSRHIAFEVALEDLDSAIAALKAKEVPTKGFMGEPTETPIVFGWMPAASIYFNDPDGHLLEYIASLPGEAAPDRVVVDWETWHEQG